jgi:hypothetical protein
MFKSIAMIVAGLSTTATVAFAAAETAGPVQTPASAYELSESERAVFVDYLVCSETAAIRIMSESEAAPCILLYTEVKLTFVPEFDLITFLQMPPMERQVVNMEGYAGYVEWRAANPELFEELSEEARGRIAGQVN